MERLEGPGPSDLIHPLEPSHLWILGLAIDEEGRVVGPGRRKYSYEADCECPGYCLRDHDSE